MSNTAFSWVGEDGEPGSHTEDCSDEFDAREMAARLSSENGCVRVSVVHDCGDGRLYKCGTTASPGEKFVARVVHSDPNDSEELEEESAPEESSEEEEEEVDLETLTKGELIALAEEHEIELPNRATKTEMVDFLAEAFDA